MKKNENELSEAEIFKEGLYERAEELPPEKREKFKKWLDSVEIEDGSDKRLKQMYEIERRRHRLKYGKTLRDYKECVVYIHGLGGSGNGSSARNVKATLGEDYDFYAGIYNLLEPKKAFEKIRHDIKYSDFVIASSLGAFYAASVNVGTRMLLLNPCLEPEKAIKNILYPEQKKDFDEEKCLAEWAEIKNGWSEIDREDKGKRFAVFSDKDELFSFYDVYKENFGTFYGMENFCMIDGTHEIAKKHAIRLLDAPIGTVVEF